MPLSFLRRAQTLPPTPNREGVIAAVYISISSVRHFCVPLLCRLCDAKFAFSRVASARNSLPDDGSRRYRRATSFASNSSRNRAC
jgi:hypothetical protein